jgi:Protein of unknown function (DUF3102)
VADNTIPVAEPDAAVEASQSARMERICKLHDYARDGFNIARTNIIKIGHELISAKAELAHGEWLPWLEQLERRLGWSKSTAENYMAVGRKFPNASEFDDLSIDLTALYIFSPVRTCHRLRATRCW